MKKVLFSFALLITSVLSLTAQGKYVTRTGQAKIFSHTSAEDITALNNTVTGVINPVSGEVAISVPVQSFQFEKSMMQEHFNNTNFMDSKQYPKISLKGKITNLPDIDLSKNGKYEAAITGDLTIKGVTKPITEKATIEVNNGKVTVSAKFVIKEIGSYGVGKPSGSKKNNVADNIDVTYTAVYDLSSE